GVVLAADNRRVRSGLEVLEQDGRLARIAGRKTGGFDLRLLIGLPIVVRGDDIAVAIMQFEHRIRHRLRDTELRERRSDGANNYTGKRRRVRTGEEPADKHVVTRADEATRTDVGQPRVRRQTDIVDLDNTDAAGVVLATHDQRVK